MRGRFKIGDVVVGRYYDGKGTGTREHFMITKADPNWPTGPCLNGTRAGQTFGMGSETELASPPWPDVVAIAVAAYALTGKVPDGSSNFDA